MTQAILLAIFGMHLTYLTGTATRCIKGNRYGKIGHRHFTLHTYLRSENYSVQ